MSTPGGQFIFAAENVALDRMQTVQETRRQRIGILKASHRTWALLNLAIGWDRTNTRLSQIHSGTLRSDRGTPFTLGDDSAREIERALGLEPGWMDTPPTYAELHDQNDPIARAILILQTMEPAGRFQAVRLLDALCSDPLTSNTSPAQTT